MLFSKKICYLIIFLIVALTLNCTDTLSIKESAGENDHKLSYQVIIDGFSTDSIIFKLVSDEYTDFILPYHYADNPMHNLDSTITNDIEIIDCNGNIVPYTCSRKTFGLAENTVIHIDNSVNQPVTISYRVNDRAVSSGNRINNDALALSDSTFTCLGNAVFIIPLISYDLTTLWRTGVSINVNVENGTSFPVFGIPSSGRYTCDNIYELLFNQLYVGQKPIIEGYGGSVKFAFLNFSLTPVPEDSFSSIRSNFSSILDAIYNIYGPFNNDMLTVSLDSVGGGLEGTYSFTQLLPSSPSFYYVLSHEALHQFIGIRCGEYDDPWWKEGATTYLSYLIAVRLGLCNMEDFRKTMTVKYSPSDSSYSYKALSDSWWRANMFSTNMFDIIYTKGAQVMMLFDLATRTASDNRYSIEDVSADLIRQFDGKAFHRSDFYEAFRQHGNPDVNRIFRDYIDLSDNNPSDSLLDAAFSRLDSLGAFKTPVILSENISVH